MERGVESKLSGDHLKGSGKNAIPRKYLILWQLQDLSDLFRVSPRLVRFVWLRRLGGVVR